MYVHLRYTVTTRTRMTWSFIHAMYFKFKLTRQYNLEPDEASLAAKESTGSIWSSPGLECLVDRPRGGFRIVGIWKLDTASVPAAYLKVIGR